MEIKNMLSGILIVGKPTGPTSHDVVDQIRRIFNIKKVGHAGTLDPKASGVLIILLGKATKLSSKLSKQDKTYQVEVIFGFETETGDMEENSNLKSQISKLKIKKEKLEKTLKEFVGEIIQRVPHYSAVKIKGQKLYRLARKGEKISEKKLPKRKVKIHYIKLLEFSSPKAKIEVHCSKGTYIRSLVIDLGRKLGLGATVLGLVRTKSGNFSLREAITLAKLKKSTNPTKFLIQDV